MKFNSVLQVVFLLLLLFIAETFYAQGYDVIVLGNSNGQSYILGSNDSSQAVGGLTNPMIVLSDSAYGLPGGVHILNVTPLNIGFLSDINDSGKVVGTMFGFGPRGFIWQNGVVTYIDTNVSITARAINKDGVIVGQKHIPGQTYYRGFRGKLNNLASLVALTDTTDSEAFDINSAGLTVGYSALNHDNDLGWLWRAVRWNENGVIKNLGLLPGHKISQAKKINDNGVIVGYSTIGGVDDNLHAVIWENDVIRDLNFIYTSSISINNKKEVVGGPYYWKDELVYRLDTLISQDEGVTHLSAYEINNLGQIFAAGIINDTARILLLQPNLNVTNPHANDKWIAGETDTIKWTGGLKDQLLQIEFSVDSGSTFEMIDCGIKGDTGVYAWDIPEDILSKKCLIRIFDMNDNTIVDTSEVLKIKGYVLTRDSSGQYEPFRTNQDQWGFRNISEDMWPPVWYQQFDYQGEDPFTGLQYSQWQGNFVFASTISAEFPDWEAFVNAFSVNACYQSTTIGIYSPIALFRWNKNKGLWKGSCFGIAAASSLAFTWKDQFLAKYPLFPEFNEPVNVNSNDGVKKVVNELFSHQFGNPSIINDIASANKTPNKTLNELKQMLSEDDVQPKTITIFKGSGGAHTILPYRVRQDANQKNKYYVDVYDNSQPSSNNPVTIDTTGNNNNGSWSTPDWPGWNGKFYLEITSNQYLNGATLPKGQSSQSPFILPENILEINNTSNSQIEIKDTQGSSTGYFNNQVIEDIPGSIALMIKNGSEGPPYGYLFETDTYSVKLDQFEEDTVETYFFTGNKSFVYGREGALLNQTDRLFFDGGLSAVNPDAQMKTVQLLNLINESTQEKLTSIRSLELSQNDSVKIDNPDSNKVKLVSYGSAKDYDIELNYVTENGIGRFGYTDVDLPSNTTHTFVPEWIKLSNSELTVLVDNGNNGTVDDTLFLKNNLTGIGEDEGSLIPTEYNLTQNYPNPFNPVTNISYSIPQTSYTKLVVYDILGNEITTLVNEEKSPGVYSVLFDASHLASGIYLYKLEAGSFTQVRKMMLIK